ncbi:MAG: hypothetical protein RL497_1890 [Pseudomonadota bacterium]
MAKKSGANASATSSDSNVALVKTPTLPNCSPDKITTATLPKGTQLHRVHQQAYSGDAFNAHPDSNARFSTIHDTERAVIPTVYLASTFEGALMETVFHDIPYQQGDKFLDRAKIEGQQHSVVATREDILLADLTTIPLKPRNLSWITQVCASPWHV